MTLTAFVTSNTRYKFNTDATDRVSTNFVRDSTYLATKSELNVTAPKDGKKEKKIKVSYHGQTGEINHHYGERQRQDSSSSNISFGDNSPASDDTPVAEGDSPDMPFFRYVLVIERRNCFSSTHVAYC
jgi:hypothetical protein